VVRHEVAGGEWARWLGNADEVGDVAPGQCSRPVSALTCVAGNGGVRSSGFKLKGFPLHPGATGKGKTGRVNVSELLMTGTAWSRSPGRLDNWPDTGQRARTRKDADVDRVSL
jgi:hypothetical protein